MNRSSCLPNLERAYLFRQRMKSLDSNQSENPVFEIIKENPEWFDFRKKPWKNIRHDTLSEINFPSVSYTADADDLYQELNPSHIYYFSLGNYGIRRGLNYLNSSEYEQNLFELQILPTDSSHYKVIKRKYFNNLPIRIVRFKVQSYHKKQHFNKDGYRGYFCYLPVTHFDPLRNDRFRLLENSPVTNLTESDFYFKNAFKGHFCTCKTGSRLIGSCSHLIAAMIGFGNPSDFSKKRYVPQYPESFSFPQY